MTFGIINTEEPLLAELLSLAFESAGHDCLVLKDFDHATLVLREFRLDSIVLDLHVSGRSGLDWLETVIPHWPDLPSRTLLLTGAAVSSAEADRITALGVDVALKPASVVAVEWVVWSRVRKAWTERLSGSRTGSELLN